MKLLVLILNKIEVLEPLMEQFQDNDIHGATILNSTGMARALSHYADDNFLTGLRSLLDPDREENRTIFTVLKEEQVAAAVAVIEKVVGDLSKPDTAIVFTLPVDFVKGVNLN
ncbi:MAG: hypothetical protein PHG02_06800 [Oscillospiraceae bacterium]|nr:hypothetical protein [Oscillospiraceae bacterium]